jgi:splicing suppressor protein 51
MVFPGNYLVGPPTASSRSETSQQPVISPRRGLSEPREEPFTNLQAQSWLHGRPEDDVYRLLIDSYRLHSYDKFQFEKENKLGSIFAGATDSAHDFSSYLSAAAGRPTFLPQWWTRANHQDCVRMGLRHAQFHDLHVQLNQAMVVYYYRDASFPTQLRLFAEQVLGRPVIMRSCTPVLDKLALMEKELGDTACFEWKKYNKAFAIQKWPGRF